MNTTEGQAKIREYMQHKWGCTFGKHVPGRGDACESCSCGLDEALSLLSPPIVGEPVAWMSPGGMSFISEKQRQSLDAFNAHLGEQGRPPINEEMFPIPLYLAQAPQSSPAPPVIEAGDAMLSRLQHSSPKCLSGEKCVCGLAEIYERWDAAKASRPSVTAPVISWHKAGEFPPAQIPEGHILIGYSNRVGKDEDYSLRQLACYPDKGPWTDWYGAVPNPDYWAIIPVPDKDIARWYMPQRATPQVTAEHVLSLSPAPTYAMSRDYDRLYALLKEGEQVLVWVTYKDTDYPAVAERMLGGCSVSSLGHTFFNAIACSTERTLFVTECTRLNLEWLSPAAQGVTVDQLVEQVWKTTNYWLEKTLSDAYKEQVRKDLTSLLTK